MAQTGNGLSFELSRDGKAKFSEEKLSAKIKGCDFGYALADNSCEGVPGVEACTVAAHDVTTAFAVPDLG